MLNKEIISATIPSLHLNDPVSQALDLMADFHVTHLPVVVEDKLAGLISEDDLLNVDNDEILLFLEAEGPDGHGLPPGMLLVNPQGCHHGTKQPPQRPSVSRNTS